MFGRKKEKKKAVEFHYKDRVKITKGFYGGQTGTLRDRMRVPMGLHSYISRYQIKLDNDKTIIWVSESVMKKTS